MVKKLDPNAETDNTNVEWDMLASDLFKQIMNWAYADFIDPDITRMDAIKWSSVSTLTGVFSPVAANSARQTMLND